MARNIITTKIDNVEYVNFPMVLCGTGSTEQLKTIVYPGFVQATGATIMIRFAYGNSVDNPIIQIGNNTPKALYDHKGPIRASQIKPEAQYLFFFDGTYWTLVGEIPDHEKNTVTARAGTNTSGTTITIPFVSVNTATGHVTNLGTRTHTVPGIDTSVIDTLQSTITQQQQQINDLKSTFESIITGKTWNPSIWGSGDGTTAEGSGGEETQESQSTPIMTGQPS